MINTVQPAATRTRSPQLSFLSLGLMQTILRTVILSYMLVLSASASEPTLPRSFNGIVATFRIKNPVIKLGEDLEVVVVYRNVSHRTVNFHFFQADEKAELYPKGSRQPLVNVFTGEPQYSDVILKPGESARFQEVFDLKGWPDLVAGNYEIRFYYHLALLFDKSLAEKYRRKYPVEYDLVPWEDRRHLFTITK